MEMTADMIKAVTTEVQEAKVTLQALTNEVSTLFGAVAPAMMDGINGIRASRMTVVNEVRDALSTLRDLRKFFLEEDHEKEMDRLERFVRVCKDLQALKVAGVLDAVCDSAIRLALKESAGG